MPSHTVHRRRGAPAEAFQAKPTLVGARVQHRKYIGAVRRQYASYMTLLLGFCLLGFGAWEFASPSPPPAVGTHWRTGRSLLSSNSTGSDSSHGGVLDTCSYEEDHAPVAWVLFYLLVVYQIFLGIAILCDDHFVPSLEAITEILDLSEDVAGATFMAAGSSAPELFTSLAGIAMGHAEVGAGTIVGSAVFNILVIIALSAALAGEILSVDYRCIVRDGSFYGISIILFIIFSNDSYFYVRLAACLPACLPLACAGLTAAACTHTHSLSLSLWTALRVGRPDADAHRLVSTTYVAHRHPNTHLALLCGFGIGAPEACV